MPALLAALWLLAAVDAGVPQEETELDALPPEAPPPDAPAERGPRLRSKLFLEDAAGFAGLRDQLVPAPPPPPPTWQEHLAADWRADVSLSPRLTLLYSARGDARAETSLDFPSSEDLRLDVRELFLRWTPLQSLVLEAGRINLKNGVALGRNPTDYFKTKAVVEPLSFDPAALRENRLGAAMVRAGYQWGVTNISIAYAPKLEGPRPVYATSTLPSLDPMLDRTNDAHRLLVKAGADWKSGLGAELLGYLENDRLSFGANLSRGVGDSVILYLEASATRRASLVDEALRYGKRTGTIPPQAPAPLADDAGLSFQADASAGGSWTIAGRLTVNLEYHFHQAGFSRATWSGWFDAGERGPARPLLWYIRGYASEQQEMVSRHEAFVRFDWPDFAVRNLELTGFVLVDAQDGSCIAQAAADFYLSSQWTVGALGIVQAGGPRSQFGSLSQTAGVLFKLRRYF